MFDFKDGNFENNRQGYLFSYSQMIFNQARRLMIIDINPDKKKEPEGFRKFTYQYEKEAKKKECKMLCVLTSALFVEAYIFDYCARKKSANYFSKYLDKLDPVSKWIITTKLLCYPGIEEGSDIIRKLNSLFTFRNKLVHHKTKSSTEFMGTPEFPEELSPLKCITIIKELLEILIILDPNEQFAGFVLSHFKSWIKNTSKNPEMYPILWEA